VHVGEQVVVVDLDDVGGAAVVAGHQCELAALVQHHALVGHVAGTDLGPGQVDEDPHRSARGSGRGTDALVALEPRFERLVGEAHSGDVHARVDHRAEDLRIVGGGSDGCDDLGPASHGCTLQAPGPRPAVPAMTSS
jgi:hypothetical protein